MPRQLTRRGRSCPLWSLLSCALLSACATHRGEWRTDRASPEATTTTADASVRLFVFGDVGESGRWAGPTSARLAERVANALAAGEQPIVLWLGDNLGPRGPATKSIADTRERTCTTVDSALGRPALAQLAAAVSDPRVTNYAVLGERDWQCGAPELLVSGGKTKLPWKMPAHNYVVRVYADGSSEVVSSCSAENICTLKQSAKRPLAELVMVDSAAWISRHPQGSPAAIQAEASNAQQVALLDTISAGARDTLRILVMHHPVETAGPHGQGGLRADSAFLYHHPRLQQALREGVFRGVISAHDRSLQVAHDLADGVKRSSRVWLDAPVFQVVAGATSKPDGRALAGARRLRFYQGQSIEPELNSSHAGFGELWLSGETIGVRMHALARRWHVGEAQLPVAAPAFSEQTPSPGMEPCINCNAPTAAR